MREKENERAVKLALEAIECAEKDNETKYGSSHLAAKLAVHEPEVVICEVVDRYRAWLEYESFPGSSDGTPSDGDGYLAKIADRQPTEEVMHDLRSRGDFDLWDNRSGLREILITLAQIGLYPRSPEWVEGALARNSGIPELGRRGDWGSGWLFAHWFTPWHGLKAFNSCMKESHSRMHDLLSPSEWRWAVMNGYAPQRWSEHIGNGNWKWESLCTEREPLTGTASVSRRSGDEWLLRSVDELLLDGPGDFEQDGFGRAAIVKD